MIQKFKAKNLYAAETLCRKILSNDYWVISKEEVSNVYDRVVLLLKDPFCGRPPLLKDRAFVI